MSAARHRPEHREARQVAGGSRGAGADRWAGRRHVSDGVVTPKERGHDRFRRLSFIDPLSRRSAASCATALVRCEQAQREPTRVDDPRKIWKLSSMVLKSHSRWATRTPAPRRRVCSHFDGMGAVGRRCTATHNAQRVNLITHLLSQVPYEPLTRKKVTSTKRQESGEYREPDLEPHLIATSDGSTAAGSRCVRRSPLPCRVDRPTSVGPDLEVVACARW